MVGGRNIFIKSLSQKHKIFGLRVWGVDGRWSPAWKKWRRKWGRIILTSPPSSTMEPCHQTPATCSLCTGWFLPLVPRLNSQIIGLRSFQGYWWGLQTWGFDLINIHLMIERDFISHGIISAVQYFLCYLQGPYGESGDPISIPEHSGGRGSMGLLQWGYTPHPYTIGKS